MKRVYVDEKWCLGCHLCEYYCAFANSGKSSMIKALKDRTIHPRIRIEGDNQVSFAVSCRHCTDPLCVKSCIAGALSKKDGVVCIDQNKCVGCHTCVLVCPYGALMPSESGVMQKCELCIENAGGKPACVQGCPNKAIITAGTYDGETYVRRDSESYKILFYKDDVLKGYILIGDVARAGIYTALIRNRTPLSSIDFKLICEKPQLMAFTARTRRDLLSKQQ